MRATISKEFRFEAAHRLPNVPPDHKCSRLHGHSFLVTIRVDGMVDESVGWVVDFALISKAMRPIIDQLDHQYLNEIPGLDNPTSENIAKWIWDHVVTSNIIIPISVSVSETCTTRCEYYGQYIARCPKRLW